MKQRDGKLSVRAKVRQRGVNVELLTTVGSVPKLQSSLTHRSIHARVFRFLLVVAFDPDLTLLELDVSLRIRGSRLDHIAL